VRPDAYLFSPTLSTPRGTGPKRTIRPGGRAFGRDPKQVRARWRVSRGGYPRVISLCPGVPYLLFTLTSAATA
jgi:hypothetical protein